jgi:hypothetical protein
MDQNGPAGGEVQVEDAAGLAAQLAGTAGPGQ